MRGKKSLHYQWDNALSLFLAQTAPKEPKSFGDLFTKYREGVVEWKMSHQDEDDPAQSSGLTKQTNRPHAAIVTGALLRFWLLVCCTGESRE